LYLTSYKYTAQYPLTSALCSDSIVFTNNQKTMWVRVCVEIYKCALMCMYRCVFMYVCMSMSVYMFACVCMHVQGCAGVCVSMCVPCTQVAQKSRVCSRHYLFSSIHFEIEAMHWTLNLYIIVVTQSTP
jgi:hypothetical protein